jgi:hypothetical protein
MREGAPSRETAEEKRLVEHTITWATGTLAFSELPPKQLALVAPQSLCERTDTNYQTPEPTVSFPNVNVVLPEHPEESGT